MIQKVMINGWEWYINLDKKILSDTSTFKSFTTFNYLTSNELDQIKNYIRYR